MIKQAMQPQNVIGSNNENQMSLLGTEANEVSNLFNFSCM